MQTSSFIEELDRLLAAAVEEYEKIEKLRENAAGVIHALEITRGRYEAAHDLPSTEQPSPLTNELKGLTQMQAMIRIAGRNNGLVVMREARSELVRAGLIRSKRNGNNIIYTLIRRSDRFEKVRPGVYRLLPEKRRNAVQDSDLFGGGSMPRIYGEGETIRPTVGAGGSRVAG